MMKNNPLEELFKDDRSRVEPAKESWGKHGLIMALSLSLLISLVVTVLFNSNFMTNNKQKEQLS
ncbi:MAG: hypothetical protein K0B81_07025 [Candidatus Cloacimonetes bacterium]|nr:hypothetical protein [Candidatus Cloacimonadota bacterium]